MTIVRFLPVVLAALSSAAFAQAPSIGGCSVFPANNIWNTKVDSLPVAATSAAYVTTIGTAKPLHPDFGSGGIGIPVITVTNAQPAVPVAFQYAAESDPGPYPIPVTAPIEGGSASTGDRHVLAVNTSTCRLYELYGSYPQAASWTAASGASYDLSSNALRPAGWTSADAAGLPIFPGLVRFDEVAAGAINHALRFTVPQTRNAYVWPARHFASSLTGSGYPPMGSRFRLRAGFDISGFSHNDQVILQALKTYGMILADNGSSWYVSGVSDSRWNNTELHALTTITGSNFEQVDVAPLMVNVNTGDALVSVPPPPPVSVTVTPGSLGVRPASTAQLTATVVNGQGLPVTWKVNGVTGGNATLGTVSATGLYTAPSAVPAGGSVVVQATVSGVTAGATVMVQQTVTITLNYTQANLWTRLQFIATPSVPLSAGVIWKVNGIAGGNSVVGTITPAGLYTTPVLAPNPATVQVAAVSAADPTVFAVAAVTVMR